MIEQTRDLSAPSRASGVGTLVISDLRSPIADLAWLDLVYREGAKTRRNTRNGVVSPCGRGFYGRPCSGRAWRRRFPDANKEDIRAFLGLFVDAFALRRKPRVAFGPDDRIMDVYRALYPIAGLPDALELETFDMRLEEQYGVKLVDFYRPDLTLGEVFGRIKPTPH